MDYKERLKELFDELFDTQKKIAIMEEYVDQSYLGGPDKPTYLTRSAPQLYTHRARLTWAIEDLVREDAINKERSKSRFKRLFNR